MAESQRYDVRVLVRAEEGVETPASIDYRELVFCPDARNGEGQVYIGRRDGTPMPLISAAAN
ncbi:MAG: hypothetical protein AAF766_22805 [Cyanobacteria bacterium P01_D01_bin.14]